MINLHSRISKALLLSIIATVAVYLLVEVLHQLNAQKVEQSAQTSELYLTEASRAFSDFYNNFKSSSESLALETQESIVAANDHEAVHQKINSNQFWGVTLFKNSTPHVWTEFGEISIPFGVQQTLDHPIYSIFRKGNSTLIVYQNTIYKTADDSTLYTLVTSSLLEQSQLLPFAASTSISIPNALDLSPESPVQFSFLGNIADEVLDMSPLLMSEQDTVGYAYIDNLTPKVLMVDQSIQSWRLWFVCLIIVLTSLFFFFSVRLSSEKWLFASRLIIVLVLWLADSIYLPGLSSYLAGVFALDAGSTLSLFKLFYYSGLLFLLNFMINSYLSTEDHRTIPQSGFLGIHILFGATTTTILYWLFTSSVRALQYNDIELFDLSIVPGTPTIIFYILSSLALVAVSALYRTVFNFAFESREHIPFAISIWAGVIIATSTVILTNPGWENAMFLALTVALIIIVHIRVYTKVKKHWTYTSVTRPRLLIVGCLVITSLMLILGVTANQNKIDDSLVNSTTTFTETIDVTDSNIINSLLRNAESNLNTITAADISTRSAFVQTKLNESLPIIIQPSWLEYSIDLRIVDTGGKEIAAYSSDLETPNWTRIFDIASLEIPYQQEQISRQLNRPIIRLRPYNDLPDKYSSFKRGWIPLFDPERTDETKIAWILCTIYKEPSKFDKPLRSILSSGAQDAGNSILVSSYNSGTLDKSTFYGKPNTFEDDEELPAEIISQTNADVPLIVRSVTGDLTRKELYLELNENTILKASTQIPSFQNYIFAFTRFFIVIFLFGFVVTAIFSLAGIHRLGIFGHTRRFQYRLLDRVTYAIILCLVGLIVTTSFAVENQNEELIRNNLNNELENLADALQLESSISEDAPSLERATFSLDVDATLYSNGVLNESTVSQIYQQNLLPELLPWHIYNQLSNSNSQQVIESTTFVDEPLLVGYKRIQGSSNIIAIPTFISSPKYSQQLLTSNSYLLGFYILIFGLFTIASAIIARSLTMPLNNIKGALKTIGEGNLETMLDVKSEDEIGSLTNAYNEMVIKLKKLQADLALAEREAAWKEMAQQVAHEIKNPLTPMKLSLQHLERQIQTTETSLESLQPNVQRIAHNMIEQIEALDKIASDFSKFAKPMELPFTRVGLNALIAQVVELHQYHESAEINLKLPKKQVCVEGVADELRGVFVNVIKNALEAIAENGKISITLSSNKNDAVVSIQDNGSGISEEDRNKIFVPNFSTKSSGTGLGLAISKKVIEAHNGSIDYVSDTKKGSTFTICLPKV